MTKKPPLSLSARTNSSTIVLAVGESGTALTFIMDFDRLEFVEAVENLAQRPVSKCLGSRGRS